MIGTDLNNEITTGNCVNGTFSAGVIFAGLSAQTTGAATNKGPIDEITCNFDRGREVWIRFSLNPLAFWK